MLPGVVGFPVDEPGGVAGAELVVEPGPAEPGTVVELAGAVSPAPRPSAVDAGEDGAPDVTVGSATWSRQMTGAGAPPPEPATAPTAMRPAVTATATAATPARRRGGSPDHLARNAPMRPIRQVSTLRRSGLRIPPTR